MSGQKDVDKHRVRLTHKVVESDQIKDVELPWTMAVLMDGYGNHPDSKKNGLYDSELTEVTSENYEKILKKAKPKIQVKVKDHFSDNPEKELIADVTIETMKDFEPDAIASKVPELKDAYDARVKLQALLQYLESSRPTKLKLDQLFDGSDGESGDIAESLAKLLSEIPLLKTNEESNQSQTDNNA